jgi:cytochrome c1
VKNILKISYLYPFYYLVGTNQANSAEKVELLKTDWSFKGLCLENLIRGSLQRGYQVYTEVCSSCHSMKYVSYRNLAEEVDQNLQRNRLKAIAASFEVLQMDQIVMEKCLQDQLNSQINLLCLTKMRKQPKQQMEGLTHQTCQY